VVLFLFVEVSVYCCVVQIQRTLSILPMLTTTDLDRRHSTVYLYCDVC